MEPKKSLTLNQAKIVLLLRGRKPPFFYYKINFKIIIVPKFR